MQVRCPHCDTHTDLERLDTVPGGFGFVCLACGEVAVLAPAVAGHQRGGDDDDRRNGGHSDGRGDGANISARDAARAEPARVECPKCSHRQPPGDEACHRCGLMFAYAATGRARLPVDPLEGHPAAETIRARWAALAADLDDRAGHQAFIGLCAEADLLEFAGASYRRLADEHPDDTRVADYRQQVLKAAMARVGRAGQRALSADRNRMRRLLALLVAALVLLVLAFGYYLLTRYQVARQFDG